MMYQKDVAVEDSVAASSITERQARRVATTNWNLKTASGDSGSQRRHMQRGEIDAILKEHDGEARVWQTYPESWVR